MNTIKPIRLIPAIDLIDGKCVRLSQGDYATKKVYAEDPLAVAKAFEDAGIQYLHLVDLDGAKAGKVVNYEVIERLCSETNLTIDFGGGLRTTEEVARVLELGVQQITAGSIAAKHPEKVKEWMEIFGAEKIIVGADIKDGAIATHGWEQSSGRKWKEFMDYYVKLGIQYFVCTDVAKDGMLSGPSTELYQEMIKTFPRIKLVASGGVAQFSDLEELSDAKLDAVIFGKAFYEGNIALSELEKMIKSGQAC